MPIYRQIQSITDISVSDASLLCTIDFNLKKMVYWISLWPYTTEDAERPSWGLYTRKSKKKNYDMVLAHWRLKVRKIVEALEISHGSVVSILNDHSGMRKLSARWVPRFLFTVDHNRNRGTTFQEVFAPLCKTGRNMDPSQHTRDQITLKTVGF